ncbi:hypothetical protein [Pseudomonas sp. RC2C2]|uniref:hypothetical protein n=1 Tax=Pseudomonas sp. RC2C2 TaxID=2834408 RepID=UPI001BCF5224|nr:hypothetical protein [Pseudomonas sp. RC2C2]MBS7601066.1 hypothetical protein [Pseudomonas sp. RC2C2]
MRRKPSNKLISERSGLTEEQVERYLEDIIFERRTGDWVVYFAVSAESDPAVAGKLSPSKTLLILREELTDSDFDYDNE